MTVVVESPPSGNTPELHWTKGIGCERLGERIAQDVERPEWAIVLYFYAALHYTKARLIAEHGVWSSRHAQHQDSSTVYMGHNDLVREYLGRQVFKPYKQLYDLGREVRYRFTYDAGKVTETVQEAYEDLGAIRAAVRQQGWQ